MTDVWKIGQKYKAESYYELSPILSEQCFWGGSDVMKANLMTQICQEMSKTFDQIIEDQNDYQMEIDAQLNEIENLKLELEQKVEERQAEKEKLVKAAGEEGLSDEDQAKYDALDNEIKGFTDYTNSKITGLNDKVTTTANSAKTDLNKAEIATDYGETALEKGQPLADMQDKTKSFWRKTFGGWNKAPEREAGKKLVDAGTELLDQVATSSKIEKNINQKIKLIYK